MGHEIIASAGVLSFEGGKLVKIDGQRPSYMDGYRLIRAVNALAEDVLSARRNALVEAAKIARDGCLVPPDGGSPTDAEREMCDAISARILAAS